MTTEDKKCAATAESAKVAPPGSPKRDNRLFRIVLLTVSLVVVLCLGAVGIWALRLTASHPADFDASAALSPPRRVGKITTPFWDSRIYSFGEIFGMAPLVAEVTIQSWVGETQQGSSVGQTCYRATVNRVYKNTTGGEPAEILLIQEGCSQKTYSGHSLYRLGERLLLCLTPAAEYALKVETGGEVSYHGIGSPVNDLFLTEYEGETYAIDRYTLGYSMADLTPYRSELSRQIRNAANAADPALSLGDSSYAYRLADVEQLIEQYRASNATDTGSPNADEWDAPVYVGEEEVIPAESQLYTFGEVYRLADRVALLTIVAYEGEKTVGGVTYSCYEASYKEYKQAGSSVGYLTLLQEGGASRTIQGYPLFHRGDRLLAFLRQVTADNENAYVPIGMQDHLMRIVSSVGEEDSVALKQGTHDNFTELEESKTGSVEAAEELLFESQPELENSGVTFSGAYRFNDIRLLLLRISGGRETKYSE